MLPGLLRAVFSGIPEGGPAGGLLNAEALSFGACSARLLPAMVQVLVCQAVQRLPHAFIR